MTINERIFELLDKDGFSIAGLAKALCINTNVISQWRSRHSDPPARQIMQICDYFGVSAEYLLTGEEHHHKNITLDDDELRVITKYRNLDLDGKDAVRGIMLQEQRRIELDQGMAKTSAG